MSEPKEIAPPATDTADSHSEQTGRGISKRTLFKGAFAVGGLAALAKGLRPLSLLDAGEYAVDSGSVRILFGNHHIAPQSTRVIDAFYKTGDLRLSQWDASTNSSIDRSMRTAKKEGRPYFMMVDSQDASLHQNLTVVDPGQKQNADQYKAEAFSDKPPDWLFLPHPDLSKKDLYPDEIYLIDGDIRTDYGFSTLPQSQDNFFLVQGLEQFLQNRYQQKSSSKIVAESVNEAKNALPGILSEGAIASALLVAGLPDDATTRRTVLKVAASVEGAQILKGLLEGNALSLLIGKVSDPTEQKILTALNSTVRWKYADKTDILWTNGRTALAVEKALELSENHDPSVSESPIQIDLLYGSAHSAEFARIMKDQSYRHQLIAALASDMLVQINNYTKGSDIESMRNDLMRAAANSLINYKIREIHMPWGKTNITPNETEDQITSFEETLATDKVKGEIHSLKQLMRDVLRGQGVED